MRDIQRIVDRTVNEADYIIASGCTIRECSKKFNIGKTSTHKDLNERLLRINKKLYSQVHLILERNWNERAIRGGNATKRNYRKG